jgi:hypothetical protein
MLSDSRVLPCRLPVIWLDTSFFIKQSQIRSGAKIGAADRERVEYLHENIYRLVRSGQLLCPEANQQSEVWRQRDALSSSINALSLGVHASHPSIVQDRQVSRAMRAHALAAGPLEFPFSDLFSFDPIHRLKDNLSQQLFITLVETPSSDLIHQMVHDRSSIHREWDALRTRLVADKVGYPSQLQVELRGEMNEVFRGAQSCKDKMERGEEPTFNEFGNYTRALRTLRQWDELTNRSLDTSGLRAFFESDSYFVVPSIFIRAALTAALLTGNRPVQRGDAKDVEHISMMLPYADLMVVDRYMKHLICELGLDKKYKTVVCQYASGGGRLAQLG